MVHGKELCMFSWVSALESLSVSDSEPKNVLTTDRRAHFNMHSLEWAAAALPRRRLCQLVSHPQDPHANPYSNIVGAAAVALLLHFIAAQHSVTLLLCVCSQCRSTCFSPLSPSWLFLFTLPSLPPCFPHSTHTPAFPHPSCLSSSVPLPLLLPWGWGTSCSFPKVISN